MVWLTVNFLENYCILLFQTKINYVDITVMLCAVDTDVMLLCAVGTDVMLCCVQWALTSCCAVGRGHVADVILSVCSEH